MKPNEEFKNWYATEGVRTPAYPVDGETSLHEEYARIAFQGGYKAAINLCTVIIGGACCGACCTDLEKTN